MLYQKNLPVRENCDLLVVGGGPAGVACAIAAARRGLNCLLLEREGCLGGTASASGVMQLLGGRRYDAASDAMVREVGGIFDEITDRLIAEGSAVDPDTVDVHHYNPYGWYPRMAAGVACDIERLKLHLDRALREAGAHVRMYTQVIDLAKPVDERVSQAIVYDRSGMYAIQAEMFADCTGDAELANLAGCPCEKGRLEDSAMCPSTLIFYVDHVDTKRYVTYQNQHQSPKWVEIVRRLREEGIWRFPFDIFIAIQTAQEGVFMVNTVRQIDVDGTDSQSLTDATMDGRELSYELLDVMQKYFPGFEHARMRRVFDRMGVRETRRIVARKVIALEDALNGVHYEDCVASSTYNFDLPDPKRPSFDPMMGDVKQPNATRKHIHIEIPYRALLPQKIDNMIIAGRSLGAQREVMGACRVMGPCMGMGQAAGVAASLAPGGRFPDVPVVELQKLLREAGCLGVRA